nr:acyl-CoA dehydrogenase family protein [Kibdelosporangium sp. MJ126-NF4]CEL21742.1 Acyl-CoA dehydrogenase; probable dibenzothiophene desulfurization enzyme [Kibdelosporangium sp. MJ126-NF4]CTQ92522.1 Acyl-CoA dehydrogenase; probable dibenzothiophene desulfurization enzyme [Kibdelosporangium sp. MJ126-NF4]
MTHTTQSQPEPSTPTSEEDWLRRAREVSDELATDAVKRDRANRLPHREVALLKDSGLTTLVCPVEHGGGGADWPLLNRVVREVAAGDASIAQLLGYHYIWYWTPRLFGSAAEAERFEERVARERPFLAGAINPRGGEVTAHDDGDDVVFAGRKSFATGVAVADLCFLEGTDANGASVMAVVPAPQPGLVPHDNWDNMGQRLTASGAVTISDVRASASWTFGREDGVFQPRVRNTMIVPTNQLLFANMYLGIATGALRQGAEYTRTEARPWGGYERSVDEPHVLDLYGDLTAKLWSAEAFADTVAAEGLPLYADLDGVTPRSRGEHAVRVAAVKACATEVGLEVAHRIFEATGARSTANSFGFDVFWRNVRTHTLHDPVAYKRRDLGAFVLRDEVPEPTPYS